MNHSQGTQVQNWSKTFTFIVTLVVTLMHIASVVLVIIYCPGMLQSDSFKGTHCKTTSANFDVSCDGCSSDNPCVIKSDGDMTSLSNLILSYQFPHTPSLSYWNWKLTASLNIYLKVYREGLGFNETSFDNLDYFSQDISIFGSLDYALNANLEKSGQDAVMSAWHTKARVKDVKRTLSCSLMQVPEELFSEFNLNNQELPFLCTLVPAIELFPLSNSTYIFTVQIKKLNNSSDANNINLMEANSTIESQLSIVHQTSIYNQLKFYMKCIFSPIILFSLIWFLVRLCYNDLYVNIPDRLIITAALNQLLANIPTELVSSNMVVPYLYLIDPACQIITFTVLAIFWVVFTQDKLADNEPWERTTKYYWKHLLSLLLVGLLGLMTVFYLNMPFLSNPFNNHWQPGVTLPVSLALVVTLILALAAFQSYLAIIMFKVICDISIHYPTTSRAWRLKGVLVYSFIVSLLLCLALMLTLAIQILLHWNPHHSTSQPLPYGMSTAGSLLLVSQLAINVHIVFLLLALSRSSSPGEGWYAPVRPVMLTPDCRSEQVHLWDLSAAQPGPLDKFVR